MKILANSEEYDEGRYDDYFGQTQAKKYSKKIQKALNGRTVCKRVDKAEQEGGLIYEADKLGIDMYELLEALEGMCYEGTAVEISDSMYYVKDTENKAIQSPAKFVGGEYDGFETNDYYTLLSLGNGQFTDDLTESRERGGTVWRKELDNQPIVDGYLEPMWDGGKLRYETQEVYDRMTR